MTQNKKWNLLQFLSFDMGETVANCTKEKFSIKYELHSPNK